jgi:hypothetical protein
MPVRKKAYIVAVDMGYGHQRAVFPLRNNAAPNAFAFDSTTNIINANLYKGIPSADKKQWDNSQKLYEFVSRFKSVPLLGDVIFRGLDYFQKIEPFYPKRDQSHPTIQLLSIYHAIKKGWGRHLIESLNEKNNTSRGEPLPFVTSFFIPAFFADEHNYAGKIYLLCCDADVSRAWAPLKPARSRINYLVPNRRVKERLIQYGVNPEKISVTGFPLPQEYIGGKSISILKKNLAKRIAHLDTEGRYYHKYKQMLRQLSLDPTKHIDRKHPIRLTFTVGGAGAQRDLGITILKSLHKKIDAGEIHLNLIAGSRLDVYQEYRTAVKQLHVQRKHRGNISVIFAEQKTKYFEILNKTLANTDILWTKPSELSFFSGLGIPIIMAPTIGSQEESNKQWLLSIGAAFVQDDPRFTHEWLFDWLRSGWLAEAALKGFLDAPHNGTYHVEQVVFNGKKSEIESVHLL